MRNNMAAMNYSNMLSNHSKVLSTVWSEAFRTGERIPTKYTCEGRNISPPISWTDIPSNTRGIVLIMDDPDAPGGVFVHWIAFNIPPNIRMLPVSETLKDCEYHMLN